MDPPQSRSSATPLNVPPSPYLPGWFRSCYADFERPWANDLEMRRSPLHSASYQAVVNEQHDHRTHHRNQNAIEIDTRNTGSAHHRKKIPAHDGAHDSQDDIEKEAFSCFVHQLTGDKAGQQTQYDPSEK